MPYKQVIVLRKDLKLGFGKAVSQACHASLGSMKKCDRRIIKKWENEGAKKVILKINSLKSLNGIRKKVVSAKLPQFVVRDAGLTQIKKGTITCIGIGPAEKNKIDKITKNLKLL